MKQPMKLLLVLLVFFGVVKVYAQKQGQGKIDSILQELPKQKEDTNKVNLLNRLARQYIYSDPEVATKFAQQTLALANKLKWEKGIAKANMSLGVISRVESDYPAALNYDAIALKINETIGNKSDMAGCLGNMANVYADQGDRPKALEYYFKCLKVYEQLGDKSGTKRTFYRSIRKPELKVLLFGCKRMCLNPIFV